MQYVMKGGIPLTGEVMIGGAKNAALGILCAAIMTEEEVIIENLPDVRDTNRVLETLKEVGASVVRQDRHTVRICGKGVYTCRAEGDNVKSIRASYYLLGALLGRFHKAEVALPGGCNIGSRPIDQHLKGFRALGAKADIEFGMAVAEADPLVGGHIYMDVVSVGATINVMLAACLAEGSTILENAAKEPHVVDVANMLNSMGANIKGAGTDVIRIKGVSRLHGTTYSVIPDQIEAGTFMLAAAITGGNVLVRNIIPKHMEAISAKLMEIGCVVEEQDDAIRVIADKKYMHTDVKTLPYPGFPTDMQPQMTAVLCLAEGTSIVTESIFESRFRYVPELARMGATIKVVEGSAAVIKGVSRLTGAEVTAPDLRAGAALVMAGLAAEGYTVVNSVEYIQRGYESFAEKLIGLGARISLVDSEKEIMRFKLQVV